MKKGIAVIFLIALLVGIQEHRAVAQRFIKFGLMGNLGITSFKSNTNTLRSLKTGSNTGFGLNIDNYFTDNYSFHTGIGLMNHRFSTEEITTSDSLIQNIYKVKYIDIPLVLKFRSNDIGMFKIVGLFGGGIGTMFNAKKDEEVTSISTSTTLSKVENLSATQDINTFNLKFLIGVGGFYSIAGNTGLELMFEYHYGLVDVLDGDKNSGMLNTYHLKLGFIF